MPELIEKLKKYDTYIFVSPNYFRMPPGIFKDFIDRTSILYETGDLKKKRAAIIVVGAEEPKGTDICTNIIVNNFCKIQGMKVIAQKSFKSNSELKGNYNDIFENKYNKNILKDLEEIVEKLVKK